MTETISGLIAIVGRPNVGKSTLLNRLVGEKISIVSRKAQTTRHPIRGILTRQDTQFVFVDTPGFQTKYKNALNRAMNRGVTRALLDVDAIVLVVEAGRFDAADEAVIQYFPKTRPVVLAVNKIDQLNDKTQLLPELAALGERYPFSAIVPISAEKAIQLDSLLDEVRGFLPRQRFLFDEDDMTDRSERFLAAEYIREKIFRWVGDELPYATTVEIEKFEIAGALRHINAVILTDRATHKGILIGKGGATLKRIATEARQDMEKLFGGKVFLEIFVRVQPGWYNDERLLGGLGYE